MTAPESDPVHLAQMRALETLAETFREGGSVIGGAFADVLRTEWVKPVVPIPWTWTDEGTAMFEKFTDRARRVVVLSQDEARNTRRGTIVVAHLLLGLFDEAEGIGAKALADQGFDAAGLRLALTSDEPEPGGHLPFALPVKRCLELSLREALQLGHNYIGTEHLALAIARQCKDDEETRELLQQWLDPDTLRLSVIERLRAAAPNQDWVRRLKVALADHVAPSLIDEAARIAFDIMQARDATR